MKCNLKEKIKNKELTYGTWITINSTDVPDMLEELGFDWFVFDTEHAPLTQKEVSQMIQVIDVEKVCPIVRVGQVDMYSVKSYLDMGAHGILFPLVNNKEQAEMAVSYCKYPPEGIRGTAPRKASSYGLSLSEYLRKANELTTVAVQIETKDALKNLEEIANVKGVDILFVGPTDLTMSLGYLDNRDNEELIDAMKKVVYTCEKYGKTPGILAINKEEAERAKKFGFRFIGLSSDFRLLISKAGELLSEVRKTSYNLSS